MGRPIEIEKNKEYFQVYISHKILKKLIGTGPAETLRHQGKAWNLLNPVTDNGARGNETSIYYTREGLTKIFVALDRMQNSPNLDRTDLSIYLRHIQPVITQKQFDKITNQSWWSKLEENFSEIKGKNSEIPTLTEILQGSVFQESEYKRALQMPEHMAHRIKVRKRRRK